jgi:hypothetical protein
VLRHCCEYAVLLETPWLFFMAPALPTLRLLLELFTISRCCCHLRLLGAGCAIGRRWLSFGFVRKALRRSPPFWARRGTSSRAATPACVPNARRYFFCAGRAAEKEQTRGVAYAAAA